VPADAALAAPVVPWDTGRQPEAEWAAAQGISLGYRPGPTVRPAGLVTRQAMAAFLHRTAPLLET
jgi:hypothetical protein